MASTSEVLPSITASVSTSGLPALHNDEEPGEHVSSTLRRQVLIEGTALDHGPGPAAAAESPTGDSDAASPLDPEEDEVALVSVGLGAGEVASPSYPSVLEDGDAHPSSLQGYLELSTMKVDHGGQEAPSGVLNLNGIGLDAGTCRSNGYESAPQLDQENQPVASSLPLVDALLSEEELPMINEDSTFKQHAQVSSYSDVQVEGEVVEHHEDEGGSIRESDAGSTCGTVIIRSEYSTDMSRSHSDLRFSSSVRLEGDSD
jgi:hypothetical protein